MRTRRWMAAIAAFLALAGGVISARGAAAVGAPCVKVGNHEGNCGPFRDAAIPMSNGYNTRVGNNCWADPSCTQVLTAYAPEDWSVVADEPAGNLGVHTYPDVQQLTSNWCAALSKWGGCGPNGQDPPLSALSSLDSSYTETMPDDPATSAEAAWDIWMPGNTAEGYPKEVMIWVDNASRRFGGARLLAGPVSIGGQDWSLYLYPRANGGTGELIWSLGDPGSPVQQSSGTVDLLAMLTWLQSSNYLPADAAISQVDFGWEICSTGGVPETFTLSSYTLTGA